MAEAPVASVIILGWNGREYIDACLTSVLDQDFERPYEVLFVDNGSSDDSATIAERYAGVAVHRLGRNYGFCLGNNMGFERSRGDLVVFLNQDVVVHRSWLRELAAAVESSPSIKAAHSNIIHPWNPEFAAQDRNGPVTGAYSPELSRLGYVQYREVSPREQAVDTLFLSGAALMLKRDVVQEIGGYVFDPGMFLYGEDMDLGLRVRGAGYRTVAAPRAAVFHFHTLHDDVSLKTLIRTVRIIRNRLIAFWKSSDIHEFPPLAAITLIGAPFNATSFGAPPLKTAAYFLALIPPTALAAFAAVIAMPRFAARRRQVLSTRRRKRGWLLKALLFDRSHLADPPDASPSGQPISAGDRSAADSASEAKP